MVSGQWSGGRGQSGLIPKRGRWVASVTLLLLWSSGGLAQGNYGAFSASCEPVWSGPEGQYSHSRGRKAPVSFATRPQAPEGRNMAFPKHIGCLLNLLFRPSGALRVMLDGHRCLTAPARVDYLVISYMGKH